jgi:E3 ubiquitin-protein ligase UBR7
MTCNPPPANPSDSYDAAGVCYACSVQCHGEHTLVEIFTKRNFTCDCGTTRFPKTSPCSLRINPETNTKGGVHSEEPSPNNKYNQNFQNRFCGCECDYDPFQQKGTMFQCLGLGTHETGGCGEDWWHPGCVVGLGSKWFENMAAKKVKTETKDSEANGTLSTIAEDGEAPEEEDDNDPPPPPGFPAEDEFDGFLCYKCVEAHPWIKRYAGTPGFLAPVFLKQGDAVQESTPVAVPTASNGEMNGDSSKKRKAEDDETDSQTSKRHKSEFETIEAPSKPAETTEAPATAKETSPPTSACKLTTLPPLPPSQPPFSLFLAPTFRTHLCHCPSCFPLLTPHPQLLEEEETYEPPVSLDGSENNDGAPSTAGSGGSLYDRGESALRNVDRVRAIEGVMAYQHLKDKLMPFFQQFAESKQAISAEDVKGYFAKLRGDEEAIREAGERAGREGGGGGGDGRREESGY